MGNAISSQKKAVDSVRPLDQAPGASLEAFSLSDKENELSSQSVASSSSSPGNSSAVLDGSKLSPVKTTNSSSTATSSSARASLASPLSEDTPAFTTGQKRSRRDSHDLPVSFIRPAKTAKTERVAALNDVSPVAAVSSSTSSNPSIGVLSQPTPKPQHIADAVDEDKEEGEITEDEGGDGSGVIKPSLLDRISIPEKDLNQSRPIPAGQPTPSLKTNNTQRGDKRQDLPLKQPQPKSKGKKKERGGPSEYNVLDRPTSGDMGVAFSMGGLPYDGLPTVPSPKPITTGPSKHAPARWQPHGQPFASTSAHSWYTDKDKEPIQQPLPSGSSNVPQSIVVPTATAIPPPESMMNTVGEHRVSGQASQDRSSQGKKSTAIRKLLCCILLHIPS